MCETFRACAENRVSEYTPKSEMALFLEFWIDVVRFHRACAQNGNGNQAEIGSPQSLNVMYVCIDVISTTLFIYLFMYVYMFFSSSL